MRRPLTSISTVVLLSALAFAGCGGSSATAPGSTVASSRSTPASSTVSKSAGVRLRSSAFVGKIPAEYTCDGQDVSPPLEWGPVPPGTKEVALFLLGLTPTSGAKESVSVEWGIAGVNAALHKLAAGEVPPGAHIGVNIEGKARYSVCPRKGVLGRYEFALYTVPATTKIPARFVDLAALKILSSNTGPKAATGGGGFRAIYKRR